MPGGAHDLHSTVADRWSAADRGAHYSGDRWSSRRRRERDPRRIGALLAGVGGEAPRATLRALDVPCGTGRLAPALGRIAGCVVGVDVSAEMLRRAPRGAGVALARADVLRLPFPDDTFDVVACCRLLHHLASPELRRAAVAELARVCRGHLVLTYWDAASWSAWRRRAPGRLRRRVTDARVAITAAALDADLQDAGARVLRRTYSARFLSAQAYVLATVAPHRS